jgi:hypothetical protein
MATASPLCYNGFILTKGENMDYENDYNLLEDVAEEIDVWEDLEDQDEDEENSSPEGFDLIDHLERRQLLEEQF